MSLLDMPSYEGYSLSEMLTKLKYRDENLTMIYMNIINYILLLQDNEKKQEYLKYANKVQNALKETVTLFIWGLTSLPLSSEALQYFTYLLQWENHKYTFDDDFKDCYDELLKIVPCLQIGEYMGNCECGNILALIITQKGVSCHCETCKEISFSFNLTDMFQSYPSTIKHIGRPTKLVDN